MTYANPKSTLAVSIVLPILAIIAVALRFYCRAAHKTPRLWDDWLIVPAMVLTVALGGVMIWGVVDDGLGRHTPTAKTQAAKDQLTLVTKVEYIFLCLELLGFGLVKLSVIFFCRRIFVNASKRFDIVTKVFSAIVVAWSVGFTFAMIFECGTEFWALFSTAENLIKHCVKTLELAEAFVISDAITDLMILCLPLPMVWRLQMSTHRKFAVSGVFLLGGLATAASIARMAVYLKAVYAAYPPPDRDITVTELLYWSLTELGLGVVAACLPTLRLLFSDIPKDLLSNLRSVFSLHSSHSSHSRSDEAFTRLRKSSENAFPGSGHYPKASLTTVSLGGLKDVSGDLEKAEEVPMGNIVVGTQFERQETRI